MRTVLSGGGWSRASGHCWRSWPADPAVDECVSDASRPGSPPPDLSCATTARTVRARRADVGAAPDRPRPRSPRWRKPGRAPPSTARWAPSSPASAPVTSSTSKRSSIRPVTEILGPTGPDSTSVTSRWTSIPHCTFGGSDRVARTSGRPGGTASRRGFVGGSDTDVDEWIVELDRSGVVTGPRCLTP